MVVTLLQKLNIIPTKKPKRGEIKYFGPEQHPQSVAIRETVTPDGKPMSEWMNGGWNKYYWKN